MLALYGWRRSRLCSSCTYASSIVVPGTYDGGCGCSRCPPVAGVSQAATYILEGYPAALLAGPFRVQPQRPRDPGSMNFPLGIGLIVFTVVSFAWFWHCIGPLKWMPQGQARAIGLGAVVGTLIESAITGLFSGLLVGGLFYLLRVR
jgi:hypothetical protein